MTTAIPLRLQQRRRELEDKRRVYAEGIVIIDAQLAAYADADQAYKEADERAAEAPPAQSPAPPAERTRAPRRDIRGMVLAYLRDGGPLGPDQIAGGLGVRPKQVQDALSYLHLKTLVTTDGSGVWKAIASGGSQSALQRDNASAATRDAPKPVSRASDAPTLSGGMSADEDTAVHGREPSLLAQDAA